MNRAKVWNAALRLAVSLALGCALGLAVSEGSFWLLRDEADHSPQVFNLTIPSGTSERVTAGLTSVGLPAEMSFVEGDTLVVHNEDVVSHQLGPVWAPPGASVTLHFSEPNQFSYACTFQPSRYLGVEVRSRVTPWVRFQGMLSVGLPTAAMIALYSLVLVPFGTAAKPKSEAE